MPAVFARWVEGLVLAQGKNSPSVAASWQLLSGLFWAGGRSTPVVEAGRRAAQHTGTSFIFVIFFKKNETSSYDSRVAQRLASIYFSR
jgi:hypothetical protein